MVAPAEITVYHAAPTRSSRVVWLLEELGLKYKAISVDFPNELFTPEFLKVNPMGTIPYFIDGDIKMTESVAILFYLVEKYGDGKLEPSKSDIFSKAQYYEAISFFEGALAGKEVPYALLALMYPEDKKDPVVAEYMKSGALKACDVIESRFFSDGREFVAGPSFTAADVVAGHTLFVAKFLGFITEEKHPKTLAYLDTVSKRPAFGKVFNPPAEG